MPQPDLLIPRKMDPKAHPGYQQDMRDIEMWAKGLTSGVSAGGLYMQMTGPTAGNLAVWGSGNILFVGTNTPQGLFPMFGGGHTGLPLSVFTSGTNVSYVAGNGGFVYTPSAAGVKNLFSAVLFQAPQFTGPSATIGGIIYFSIIEMNGVSPSPNALHVASKTVFLHTGASHVLAAGDYNAATIVGTDLAFSGGACTAGNAGGTAPPYLVGWSVQLSYDTANNYHS